MFNSLDEYLAQLRQYPWFSTAGEAMRNGPRAANLSEAHLGWWRPLDPEQGKRKAAQWSAATHALQARARTTLSEEDLQLVFRKVSEAVGPLIWDAMGAYLTRVAPTVPDPAGEHAAAAIDAHRVILCDLGWAGVEQVLGEPGFFSALLPWYRDGRWPCGWTGQPITSRPVIL